MTTIVREFTYTKDNGEVSQRKGIEISKPRENYLMLDVTDLSDVQLAELIDCLDAVDEVRNTLMSTAEEAGLVKWRTFKPGGIS